MLQIERRKKDSTDFNSLKKGELFLAQSGCLYLKVSNEKVYRFGNTSAIAGLWHVNNLDLSEITPVEGHLEWWIK